MSLLLEALKKAEKAKAEAQREAGVAAESGAGLQLDPANAPAQRHVMTRDELPDIAQQMEFHSEDLVAAERSPPPPPPPPPERRPSAATAARTAQAEVANAERATAKKVFEAKFKEPNPKLPFQITMGVLGAFAVGTIVYFYFQLRSPPPLVNTNPPRTGAEQPVAIPEAKPAAAAKSPAAPSPPAEIPGLPSPIPATPAAGPAAAAVPAPPTTAAKPATPTAVPATPAAPPAAPVAAAKPAVAAVKPAVAASTAPAPRVAPAPGATPRPARAPVGVRRPEPAIDPRVSAAYLAYGAGDMAGARSGYERALGADPTNRDALLGLAAVEMRSQNLAGAEALYLQLLRMDPRDAHAQAGLLALRGQGADPVLVESRVKSMLANEPESAVLHFTLGNQYAQQGRWAEAQQSYFKAQTLEPDNPDIAYNLAVSLDHLRQPRLALEHYQRALALAEKRGAAFDRAAAQARAQELAK